MKIIKIKSCHECLKKFKIDYDTFEKCPFSRLTLDDRKNFADSVHPDCPLENHKPGFHDIESYYEDN